MNIFSLCYISSSVGFDYMALSAHDPVAGSPVVPLVFTGHFILGTPRWTKLSVYHYLVFVTQSLPISLASSIQLPAFSFNTRLFTHCLLK